ncbi:MAG: hypothetical protein P4L81_00590 [Candidatus Pacebacteria bacterium]|nr:hypothetical protein [Candidatus Paceibacterota bacterium]
MPPSPEQPQKEPVGPIIGIVIILALMVVGAVYFWNVQQARKTNSTALIPATAASTTSAR